VKNAHPKKAVPQPTEELLQKPHPWLDAPRPDARSLLEKIPLNILSREERAEALAAAAKAAKGMSLEDQIDEYVRAGRQVLEKIQYLSADDRRRIETGIMMEREKERLKGCSADDRAMIGRLLAETAMLFTTIGIPDCAKELLRRRQSSAGGRDKPEKEWHDLVDAKLEEYINDDPEISCLAATRELEKETIKGMPAWEGLRKYVQTALPRIKSKLRCVPGI
jgi:hypothetical protein